MKKRTLSFLLALVMCLTLLPMTALAANDMEDVIYTDNRGNQITIPGGAKSCATKVVDFTAGDSWTSDEKAMDPHDILGAPDYDKSADANYLCLGAYGSITLGFDIEIVDGEGMDIYVFEIGGHVEPTKVEVSEDLSTWIEVGTAEGSLCGIDMNGKVPADGKYKYVRVTDIDGQSSSWPGADIDAVAGLNAKVPVIASETFMSEIEKADEWGLIPDCLVGQDLTKRITRGEFAAVCVKLYENLSGKKATAAPADTFTDTTDPEILKAFQVGITNGKYDGGKRFAPDEGLNRQECATMLTRVYKKVSLPGWTLADDANFQLQFTQPALFKDDADIGGFARNSVYFMAANGVINGYTDGTFHPRNTTAAQEAAGYANATRQHALVFSTRIVEKLG